MKSFLKYTVYGCLVLIPFLACYISTGSSFDLINSALSPMMGTYFPYITGKNFVFRALTLIAFMAWALLALRHPEYRPRKSPLTVAVLAFTGVMFVAALLGVDPQKSLFSNYERMEGWIALFHYAVFYVVLTSMMKTWEKWAKLLNVYVVSNVLVVGYSMLQLLGAPNFFVAKFFPTVAAYFAKHYEITQSAERLDATIGNSAYFAMYTLFFIFLCSFLISKTQDKVMKYLYGVVIFFNLVALYYTQTRGTLIGLVVGLGVTLAILAVKEGGRIRMFASGLLVLMVLLSASIFIFKESAIVQNSNTLKRISTISLSELTSMSRLTIWKMSWEGFKERPILGYGQDNFQHVFAKHYDPVKMYNQEPWFDRSHNVFFDWLIAGGIVGFIAYFSMFFMAMWLLVKKSGIGLYPKAIFMGLLIGYFVHNIFVFDNFTSYMMYFTVLALIATLASNEDYAAKKNLKEWTIYLDPLVIVGSIIVFYTTIYGAYMANITSIRGFQVQQLLQYYPPVEVLKFHRESFEAGLAYDSFGNREVLQQYISTTYPLVSGNIASKFPDKAQAVQEELNKTVSALKAHVDAVASSSMDDAVILPLYAQVYLMAGDVDRALVLYDQANKLAPRKQLTTFNVVQGHLIAGKYDKAYELAKGAFLDQPAYDQAKQVLEVSAAYAGKMDEYKKMLADNKIEYTPNKSLASVLSSRGFYDQAIALLAEYRDRNPSEAKDIQAEINNIFKIKLTAQAKQTLPIK